MSEATCFSWWSRHSALFLVWTSAVHVPLTNRNPGRSVVMSIYGCEAPPCMNQIPTPI